MGMSGCSRRCSRRWGGGGGPVSSSISDDGVAPESFEPESLEPESFDPESFEPLSEEGTQARHGNESGWFFEDKVGFGIGDDAAMEGKG